MSKHRSGSEWIMQSNTQSASGGAVNWLWIKAIMAVLKHVRTGSLTLTLPDGLNVTYGDLMGPGPHATMIVRHSRVARRLLMGGEMGFAESYLDGDWETDDLPVFFDFVFANEKALREDIAGITPVRWANKLRHRFNANTRRGAKRNISYHYDLGNAFYASWLDPTMTYSSALFEREDQSLSEAQLAKYRRLARELDLKPGQRVLEIGCGWGGFAEVAAKEFGCDVTGITLSREQLSYARERLKKAGLGDKASFELCDYRDLRGEFDRIASIEMFEAVGEEHWPAFFNAVRNRLKPGGRAGLQVITVDDARFERYRRRVDFIQRYIFPGGMLPSPSVFKKRLEGAGLELVGRHFFGQSYARTLAQWRRTFFAAWNSIEPMGFDTRFKRMWDYYLSCCEASFKVGHTDVGQFVLRRV